MLQCIKSLRNIFVYKSQTLRNMNTVKTKKKETVDVFINDKQVTVPKHYSVIRALRDHDVTVPNFCYHERLSIAGNCRMCLIEVEGWPKPQIACATPVAPNMKIRTNSDKVLRMQESVLEFILADHPLDCPICDQGGECDLQDITYRFGNDRSRFTDIHFGGKRAVEDKDLGPLIRAEMNRCIHCTRCIRFGSQIAGIDVLGTAGRGHGMLVGTYVDKMFLSELSGNIIDLCPVGSLTSKPYKFKARPWELKRTDSIDVTDATGTNIVVCSRFNRVLRLLPREHEDVNQEWLSDKGRFSVDSLEIQRLVTPLANCQGCLETLNWDQALKCTVKIMHGVSPEKIMVLAGPQTSVETMVVAKDLLCGLGSEHYYIERDLHLSTGPDVRSGYLLNVNMRDIASADCIILIGTNPRFEAPILNVWIREAHRNNECDIYVIGPTCEFNYFVTYLGSDLSATSKINCLLANYNVPLIFVGAALYGDEEFASILEALPNYLSKKNIMSTISREASFAGALEVGYKPNGLSKLMRDPPSVLISLGADNVFYQWTPKNIKVIYIGFQGDKGSQNASIILPGTAYTESGGTYLNMEGRAQYAFPAVSPPGHARTDWKILRALAEYLGVCLKYDDDCTLLERMQEISPNLTKLNQTQVLPRTCASALSKSSSPKDFTACSNEIDIELKTLRSYYCSDVYSCNSPTLVKAHKAAHTHVTRNYAQD